MQKKRLYHIIAGKCWNDDTPRDDVNLIRVVERLGNKANGFLANLKVVEIPDDIEWHIDELGGSEEVSEDHRTWS